MGVHITTVGLVNTLLIWKWKPLHIPSRCYAGCGMLYLRYIRDTTPSSALLTLQVHKAHTKVIHNRRYIIVIGTWWIVPIVM